MLPTPEQQLGQVNQGSVLGLNVVEVVDASVLLCSLWSVELKKQYMLKLKEQVYHSA